MANLNITPLKYQPTTNQAPVLTEHGARVDLIKNGYCPDCGFQLRKKTFMGRWKTLHEVCPRIESHSAIQSPATSATLPIQTTSTSSHPPANQVQRKRFCDYGVWGEYVGELDANGLRSGRGEMKWEDGDAYTGEWKDNKWDGRGTFRFASGNVYEGEFKNNKRDGRGTYQFAIGDVYEGEWKNGKRDGRGTERYASGNAYEGDWKDDKKDGQGTYRLDNGNVYEGRFKDGKRDGRGTCRYANGAMELKVYKADLGSGEGVQWSKDRHTTWLLKDGKIVQKIGLSEAKATAKRIGFPNAPK